MEHKDLQLLPEMQIYSDALYKSHVHHLLMTAESFHVINYVYHIYGMHGQKNLQEDQYRIAQHCTPEMFGSM